MAPLEVNAAGRPVVAFYGGGAMETIVEGLNGIFFRDPSVSSLVDAMRRFDSISWDPVAIQAHARTYDTAQFQERIRDCIANVMQNHLASRYKQAKASDLQWSASK